MIMSEDHPYVEQFGNGINNYRLVRNDDPDGLYRIQWRNELLEQYNTSNNWRWCVNENLVVRQFNILQNATEFMNTLSGKDVTTDQWVVVDL